MLENFLREFIFMLEKLKLYLENFMKSIKVFLENLRISFNYPVCFKKNLPLFMY